MSIDELYYILLCENPSHKLRCNEEGLFSLIPELEECKGFNQNNEWHPYDVYEHTLRVVDNVPYLFALKIAALFHDIGKPLVYQEDEQGIGHFYGHWELSQEIFDIFAMRFNLNKDIRRFVSNLIYYHDINISKLNEQELNKLLKIFGMEGIELLYAFKKADLLAQNPKFHYKLDEYDKELKKIKMC